MSLVTADRQRTLELVRRVSLASRGDISPAVFLDRVCDAVSEAFELSRVTAVQFHSEAEEVSDLAEERPGPRPIAETPLLAQH